MERLHDDTLPDFLDGGGVRLVMFGAPSGRPTMAQAEILAELWAEYGHVQCGHIDALASAMSVRRFKVRVLPTLLVLRDGKLAARFDGFQPRDRIEAALAPAQLLQAIAA